MTIYVDGYITRNKENVLGKIETSDSSLFIGCGGLPRLDVFRPHLWGGGMFYGFLDEIRLWKTARTEEQIRKFMFTEIPLPEPDLVAYWKFNEGRGNEAFDASVNENIGTLHGGVDYALSTAPIKIMWLTADTGLQSHRNSPSCEIMVHANAKGLDKGIYKSKIMLTSTENSKQKMIIPVALKVTPVPDISIITDTLFYHNCIIGNSKNRFLTICNFGFDTLKITSIKTNNSDFTIRRSRISISPYGCKDIEIVYSAGLFGQSEGSVVVLSNDPDQPEKAVFLHVSKIIIPGYVLMRWILFAMLLIALLILSFIFSRYRLKQKSNNQLSKAVQLALENQKKQQQIIIHQSRLTSLGQMASGIAHEVNQPLQNLLLASESIQIELAETNPDIKYIKNMISEQYKDVEKINQISGHINFFSGSEKEIFEDKLNINSCINNAFSLMEKQFDNHNIQTYFNFDNKILEISGNPIKFEQVIVNLLNNARDAVDEKWNKNIPDYQKQVEVVTGQQNNTVFIKFKDNGSGISEKNITNIFLPFFTTKVLGPGTGLGLSISYRIINEMKGKIEVSSEVNVGSEFKISFPVYE